MKEIWKDVPGYEGLYQISNLGRVKSLAKYRCKNNIILKPGKNLKGYLFIGLYKNRKGKTHSIHRLVLLTFIGPSNLQCNHKDGNKENNKLGNLEYCTAKENMQHATINGLVVGLKGEKNPMFGKHLSEEHKQKISKSNKGKITSEETKLKLSKIAKIKIGEKNNQSILTENQVRRIKFIYKYIRPKYNYWKKLAQSLNISISTITNIIYNNNWKHIEV